MESWFSLFEEVKEQREVGRDIIRQMDGKIISINEVCFQCHERVGLIIDQSLGKWGKVVTLRQATVSVRVAVQALHQNGIQGQWVSFW